MSPTILVVDDDSTNLKVVGQLLKDRGYGVEVAISGQSALALLKEFTPDLILLDAMMPEMDGFETCRHIKAVPKFANVPVLFLSALDNISEMVKGLNCGALDFILKPFNSQLLLSKINLHLDLKAKTEALESINKNLEIIVAQRTAELEKANAAIIQLDEAKSEFLRIISHEIRTPLNGILGFTHLIKTACYSAEVDKYTQHLDSAVKRLERFSLNALNYTTLVTGKYTPHFQTTSLSMLVNSVVSSLETPLKNKEVTTEIVIDPDLKLFADVVFVSDCFKSVVDNAIKFSQPKSAIVIAAEQNADGIWVRITDTGKGFSQKALDSLFKPFSPGTSHFDENEGMELALCRLIMDLHRGQIKVYNLQKGASVDLFFPN
jgi:two-component system, sensor histidine kinase and response regulator